jgi:acetyltransferase-like isoleucine patch superfamily enzyme
MTDRLGSDNEDLKLFYKTLEDLHKTLDVHFKSTFNRSLPFNEEISDRWDRAQSLGFGEKSSIYDSAFVFGNVKIGKNCWIGPFTIIDGSGGLSIGDNCTISVGVHLYSHDNLKQTLTGGAVEIERSPLAIGNNTYIGPQSIIAKGITIGNQCIVAANSFVNSNMEDNTIYAGNPAKKIGTVVVEGHDVIFNYLNK